MVNLLKNNSSQGLYFTNDFGGKILAGTPEDLDLDSLTENTHWIYFDKIIRFEHKTTYNNENEFFRGFSTWNEDQCKVAANTGGHRKSVFFITVECDEDKVEYLERFGTYEVKLLSDTGRTNGLYMIKQTASTAFRKFPNNAGTLNEFCEIIIRGIDIVELAESGKDMQMCNIAVEEIWDRKN
jgi:hypothetical protein